MRLQQAARHTPKEEAALVAAYLILFVAVELAAGFHAVELGVPGQRMTLCELTHYTDRCNASAAPDTFEGGERFLRHEVSIFRASSLQCTAAADELDEVLSFGSSADDL